jgi:hypothetical protein
MEYNEFKDNILRAWPMNERIREITLERLPKKIREKIPKRVFDSMAFSLTRDSIAASLVIECIHMVYGIAHPEVVFATYPTNWWEALKQRFAPKWFLAKYPVKLTKVTAQLEELYPELEPALPKHPPFYKLTTFTRK